jgi:glucose-1-phosphatase
MKISDVIFDLGNVLVPFDWKIAVKRLLNYLPADIAEKATRDPRTLAKAINDLVDKLEIGAISFGEFHRLVALRIGLTADLNEFQRIWSQIFTLDQQMTRLGKSLTKRYGVWLASNTDEVHYDYIIRNFPEILFYKGAALSYQMGTKKPEIEYFTKAIELFGIQPDQAVFIDDLSENVEGARKIGIVGIQFTNYPALVNELTRIGLDVR